MKLKDSLLYLAIAFATSSFGCYYALTQEQLSRKINPDFSRWIKENENPQRNLEEIQELQIYKIVSGVEKGEIWMSPKHALTLGYGDCEEDAMAGAYFAGLLGYPQKILIATEGRLKRILGRYTRGHAMTLLERTQNRQKKYGLVDENVLFYPEYESIDELIGQVNLVRKQQKRPWMFKQWKVIDLDKEIGLDGRLVKKTCTRMK